MKPFKLALPVLAALVAGTLVGCTPRSSKSADVSGTIRTSLDQGGLKDVSVTQDRDKGVVTLGGHVMADGQKAQAEAIARSVAGSQVVANEIEVVPPGVEGEVKDVNDELDAGIEHNVDAALKTEGLHDGVDYTVKNRVVTLKGEVNSQTKRAHAEKVAAAVPNVQQVVNELQVKGQKATESK